MNTTSLQVKSGSTLATYAASDVPAMAHAIAESKPLAECDLEAIILALEREWKLTSATVGHKFDAAAFQIIAEEAAKNLRSEFKFLRLDELAILAAKGRALKFGEFSYVSPLLFMQWAKQYMALDERFEAHREAVKHEIPQEPQLTPEQHEALNLEALKRELSEPAKHNEHAAGMKAKLMDFCIKKKFVQVDALYLLHATAAIRSILSTKSTRTLSNTTGEEKVKREAFMRLLNASVFNRKSLNAINPTETERKAFEIAAADAKADLFDIYRDEISKKIYELEQLSK